MSIGIVAAVAVVMLIVGFLLGTRGRQIVQSAGKIAHAVCSLTIRIPAPSVDVGATADKASSNKSKAAAAAAAAASGAETAVEDEGLDLKADLLDTFLSFAQSNLDDHEDVTVNPVLMYQIRLDKERQRLAKRREALRLQLGDALDGLTEGEISSRIREHDLAGGGAAISDTSKNAMTVLIGAGARFTAVSKGDKTQAAAVAERRRLQRNIDVFISRTLGVQPGATARKPDAKGSAKKGAEGVRLKSAYEIAKETEYLPHAVHGNFVRATRSLRNAKDGRQMLREWEVHRRQQRVRDGLPEVEQCSDSDGEKDGRTSSMKKRRKAALQHTGSAALGVSAMTAAQLAELGDLFNEEHGEGMGEDDNDDKEDEVLAA